MNLLTRPLHAGRLIRRLPVAKKTVLEIVCDRCERTEYVDPDLHSNLPDLVVQFGGKPMSVKSVNDKSALEPEISVRFEELCSSCKKAIKNLMEQATKKIDWRRGKKEDELEAKGKAE